MTGTELDRLETQHDRRHGVKGPASIMCRNGTVAATFHTGLAIAMMREVLRSYEYEVAA